MKHHLNRKNLMRIIAVIGALSAVLTFIATAMSGWLICKMVRYLNTAQRTLPKVERAAQIYLDDSARRREQNSDEED